MSQIRERIQRTASRSICVAPGGNYRLGLSLDDWGASFTHSAAVVAAIATCRYTLFLPTCVKKVIPLPCSKEGKVGRGGGGGVLSFFCGKMPGRLKFRFFLGPPSPPPPPVRGGDSVGRSEGREGLKSNFSSSPPLRPTHPHPVSQSVVAAHSLPHTMTGEGGRPISLFRFRSSRVSHRRRGRGGNFGFLGGRVSNGLSPPLCRSRHSQTDKEGDSCRNFFCPVKDFSLSSSSPWKKKKRQPIYTFFPLGFPYLGKKIPESYCNILI